MTTYTNPNELASLITSRLCHDLANPVGAIYNGLELLELSGFPSTPELELVLASVQSAQSKIAFFRIAFGPENRASLSSDQIGTILKQKSSDGKTHFEWAGEEPHERKILKALFLVSLCIESCLPYGGNIRIRPSQPGWVLEATADRIDSNNTLWEHVQGAAADHVAASDIHFELLRLLLSKHNYSLEFTYSAETMRITLLGKDLF